jgi:hypothetical protein
MSREGRERRHMRAVMPEKSTSANCSAPATVPKGSMLPGGSSAESKGVARGRNRASMNKPYESTRLLRCRRGDRGNRLTLCRVDGRISSVSVDARASQNAVAAWAAIESRTSLMASLPSGNTFVCVAERASVASGGE